jgi:putative inorganic carbon (HCO3(-)) transporter
MTAGIPTTAPRMGSTLMTAACLLAIAAAIALLPLEQVVLAAGAVTAVLLVLRRPWLILLPLAALLPITSAIRLGPASVTDLLLAAAVGLWYVDGARRRTLTLRGSPVIALTAVYVGVLIASAWGAANFGEAAREVIKWVELLALLLVAPALLTHEQVPWVAAAMVMGATAQALLGLYQFIFAVGPEYFVLLGRFMRAYGSFGQPNPFGGYMGLSLPVALSLAIWAWQEIVRERTLRWQVWAWVAFYSGSTVVIAAGLLASWSRGAWLGAAAGVLVVLVLRSRPAAILSGVALLLLLAGLLLGAFSPDIIPAPVAQRMADIPEYFGLTDVLSQPVTDENFSVLERVAHWVAAQRMWALAPWLGVGPGNYAQVYPTVRLPQWEDALGHAHNIYLNAAAETGLIGLAAFLAMIATALAFVWRQLRAARRVATTYGRWRAALMVGILGVLVHVCVHNVVDNLFVQGMVLQVGLWLAIAHVDRRADRTGRSSNE